MVLRLRQIEPLDGLIQMEPLLQRRHGRVVVAAAEPDVAGHAVHAIVARVAEDDVRLVRADGADVRGLPERRARGPGPHRDEGCGGGDEQPARVGLQAPDPEEAGAEEGWEEEQRQAQKRRNALRT